MIQQAFQRIPPQYRRPELLTATIIVFVLILVEIVVSLNLVSSLILRRPTEIFGELITLIQTPETQSDLVVTSKRILITFICCSVLAGVISIILWRSETLRRAYLPFLGAIFGTPIVLLYLIFIVIFGRGTAGIVAISIPLGTIPMVVNTTDALLSVEQVYLDIADSFNASGTDKMVKVIIPDAAPDIFAGIRIGFSYIVTSVVAVEFLLVLDGGLGGRISDSYFRFKTTEMLVNITFIVLIVIVSIFVLRRIEEVIQR
jgi:ABC-type nitrate/sulfonate/bicarbonate transport system permease component